LRSFAVNNYGLWANPTLEIIEVKRGVSAMLRFGKKEIEAFARVAMSGQLFRYREGSECIRFEQRFARKLGSPHVLLTSSGSTALMAALAGYGIGPGDEVIVPAHTYMATALAVLGVGAIPVIVDVDDSIMLDPIALDDAIGPRTRAVIPVHMWGAVCDMDAIMRIAEQKNLLVVEDACQCAGGSYNGKMVGGIGNAGAFSFNFFKNMTCGEGGAVTMRDDIAAKRAECMVDSCCFYWTGRQEDFQQFAAVGSRASEFDGALMNVQLDQIDALLRKLRKIKAQILIGVADTKLWATPMNSPDGECATNVMFSFSSAIQAQDFATRVGGGVAGNTGRHTYNEWDPILEHHGAHHPAMDPFLMPQNKDCRMTYSKDMLPRSLDILSRTVMINLKPDMRQGEIKKLISKIREAASVVL